jgi:hypothetical protein
MSAFLIHQELSYVVFLADSLGAKTHSGSTSSYPVTAPKLVHVAPYVYAAHAGTLQPAIDMLSELSKELALTSEDDTAPDIRWANLSSRMKGIGESVHSKYQGIFGSSSFDVRVALVMTGNHRHPDDLAKDRSSSIVLWEVARGFEPLHVTGHLHFLGSAPLSELASSFLNQPLMLSMLRGGPLPAAQALVAAHAALCRLSSSISQEANVVIIGDDQEHTVLHGSLMSLAQAKLVKS